MIELISMVTSLLSALSIKEIMKIKRNKEISLKSNQPTILKVKDSAGESYYQLMIRDEDDGEIIIVDLRTLKSRLSEINKLVEENKITLEQFQKLKETILDPSRELDSSYISTVTNPSFVKFNKTGFNIDTKQMKKGERYYIEEEDGYFQIELNNENNLEIKEI